MPTSSFLKAGTLLKTRNPHFFCSRLWKLSIYGCLNGKHKVQWSLLVIPALMLPPRVSMVVLVLGTSRNQFY